MRAVVVGLVLCLAAPLAAASDRCAAVVSRSDIHQLCVKYRWGSIYLPRSIIDNLFNVLNRFQKNYAPLVKRGGDVAVVKDFHEYLKVNSTSEMLSLLVINLTPADSEAAFMSTGKTDGVIVPALEQWTPEQVRHLAIWLDIFFQHGAELVAQRAKLQENNVVQIADAIKDVRSLAEDPLTPPAQADSLKLDMKDFLARNAKAVDALKQNDPAAYLDVLRFQDETKGLNRETPQKAPEQVPQKVPDLSPNAPDLVPLKPPPTPVFFDPRKVREYPQASNTRSDWWSVKPEILEAVRLELAQPEVQAARALGIATAARPGIGKAAGISAYDASPEARQLLEAVKQELAASDESPQVSAYRKYVAKKETVDPDLVHWIVSKLQSAPFQ